MQLAINFNSRWTRYRMCFVVRCLLSVIVGYRYISSSSSPEAGKWWTFVEATLQQPNYLPYITHQDADKFYQSLLFQWCLYPVFSGTQIAFKEELCTVNTSDYQTFIVTPLSWHKRKDWTPFTINDIYFTYKSIIKDNYRNIPHLSNYWSLQVSADTTSVKIIFPKASNDNMVFFTNFILPAHILANISLEEYMIRFLQNPIGTTCANLQKTGKELDNYIFDLAACPNFSLKNYQIKWFRNQNILYDYIADNKQLIDFSLDPLPEDMYTASPIVLNSYLSFFFNTKRNTFSSRQRKWVAALLQHIFHTSTGTQDVFVQDPYLFSVPSMSSGEIASLILPPPVVATGNTGPIQLTGAFLRWDSGEYTFSMQQEIEEKYSMTIRFPVAYTRMSVSANGGKEYFPLSYNPTTKSFQYNFSTLYGTVVPWVNTYSIKWYTNETVTEYTMKLWYLEQVPQESPPPSTWNTTLDQPLVVIYFEDAQSNKLIAMRKSYLVQQWREDRFSFIGYTDLASLEWKLTTQEYDIALRTINFWLKKDLSSLLNTDDPLINPSAHANEALSNSITDYFLQTTEQAKTKTRESIQSLYRADPQLVILWKIVANIWIKETGWFSYPEKMYVLWRRKSLLEKIQPFQHIQVDRSQAKKPLNFLKFLLDSL